MKHFTILFAMIVAFCLGVAAGRYFFTERAQNDATVKAVDRRLNSVKSNEGGVSVRAGHNPIPKGAESMEGYLGNVLEYTELQGQDIDIMMNHPLSDSSQSQSEPTVYELRREYEISLLDSGLSRAEAARTADSFFEHLNVVNELVENELAEWYHRTDLFESPKDDDLQDSASVGDAEPSDASHAER